MMAARWRGSAARGSLILLLLTAPTGSASALFGRGRRSVRARSPILLDEERDDLSVPIRSISVSSTVLPRSVLRDAARASGVHDASPPADAVLRLASSIDAWYRRNGYVFARVTARRPVRAGRLHIIVSEPKVAEQPVTLAYYAAAGDETAEGSASDDPSAAAASPPPTPPPSLSRSVDLFRARWGLRDGPAVGAAAAPEARAARLEAALRRARDVGVAGDVLTAAEMRLQELRRRAGLPSLGPLERLYAAGGLIAVGGSTRESVVARALQLRPGEPFRWHAGSWEQLRGCGLFEEAEARARLVPPPPPRGAPPPPPPKPSASRARNNTIFVGRTRGHAGAEAPHAEVHAPYPAAALPVDTPVAKGGSNTARGEEHVSVALSVVERDARPRKPSQHCRVEPGVALAGGRLAGELAVYDHNLCGRNQQLRLDVSVRNATELRASLHDPRLGSRFGWDAKAFRRDISFRPRAAQSSGKSIVASDDDDVNANPNAADGSVAGTPPPRRGPTAGVDVSLSGRAWAGATIGFGASAEVVPTSVQAAARRRGLARVFRGGSPTSSQETPLLLNVRPEPAPRI